MEKFFTFLFFLLFFVTTNVEAQKKELSDGDIPLLSFESKIVKGEQTLMFVFHQSCSFELQVFNILGAKISSMKDTRAFGPKFITTKKLKMGSGVYLIYLKITLLDSKNKPLDELEKTIKFEAFNREA